MFWAMPTTPTFLGVRHLTLPVIGQNEHERRRQERPAEVDLLPESVARGAGERVFRYAGHSAVDDQVRGWRSIRAEGRESQPGVRAESRHHIAVAGRQREALRGDSWTTATGVECR